MRAAMEAGTANYTSPPVDSSNEPLVIGIRGYDMNRAFHGLIGDVIIFDRILSAPEVQQLYQDGQN